MAPSNVTESQSEGRSMDGMAPELKGREPEVPWILNHRGGNEVRLL
jgi:hypothetical protein